MIRALVKLLLLVVIPLVWLVYTDTYNPLHRIGGAMLSRYYEDTYRGTFYLLETRLRAVDEADWPRTLAALAPQFGYDIAIRPLSDVQQTWGISEPPQADRLLFRDDDDVKVLIKRLGAGDRVLVMYLDESKQSETAKRVQGSVALLKQYFAGTAVANYPRRLRELAPHFSFPLTLAARDAQTFAPRQREQIARWGFAWRDDAQRTFLVPLADSGFVLTAGPIPPGNRVTALFMGLLLLVLVTVLSLALLIWLYPTWRDLRLLDRSAAAFGDGHLDRRVSIRKSSIAARLGRSFNRMADNIENLIGSNRRLTNAIAHDLRTPLARLRFAQEMLASPTCTEEERRRYQRSLNTNIDALDYLINQLLTHSRYSRAVDIRHFRFADLANLIEEEIEVQRDACNDLTIVFDAADALRRNRCWIDPRAVTRALQNLLANASRYASTTIAVDLRLSDGQILLSMEDDGPGIAPAERADLLQPFVQQRNETRDSRQGHGLGLAIVNQISQWHGGSTEIGESALGGASIVLRWPARLETSTR